MEVKLTKYSRSSGCGCKISPAVLNEIIKNKSEDFIFSNLLVGNNENDDAAVIEFDNENAIISTTDFFTPIVDDAFDFGMIASCNAINDIYAMGGEPLMAIAILGWPVDKLKPELANEVIQGAKKICMQAGIPLAGGHSIDSIEPIFGLAVTGKIKKQHIKKNNTIHDGNVLYLTKPLGIGILSSALKREMLTKEEYTQFIKYTTSLNKIGQVLANKSYVNAMTDVTGFGLIGHIYEMIKPGSFKALLNRVDIPVLQSAIAYGSKFIYPDSTTRNYNAYASAIEGLKDLDMFYYCDPQTAGGLLISVSAAFENEAEQIFKNQHQEFYKIGHFEKNNEPKIIFE
jgi:selenide,water dikinase